MSQFGPRFDGSGSLISSGYLPFCVMSCGRLLMWSETQRLDQLCLLNVFLNSPIVLGGLHANIMARACMLERAC